MTQTKEQRAAKKKEYRNKNKEKLAAKHKEYYQNNKEKIATRNKEYMKEYSKTPARKKSNAIADWKRKGIKSDNYDILYDNYLKSTNCEECGIPYGKKGDGTGTWKCCDHSHVTGLFRNFLCQKCNIQRGE